MHHGTLDSVIILNGIFHIFLFSFGVSNVPDIPNFQILRDSFILVVPLTFWSINVGRCFSLNA